MEGSFVGQIWQGDRAPEIEYLDSSHCEITMKSIVELLNELKAIGESLCLIWTQPRAKGDCLVEGEAVAAIYSASLGLPFGNSGALERRTDRVLGSGSRQNPQRPVPEIGRSGRTLMLIREYRVRVVCSLLKSAPVEGHCEPTPSICLGVRINNRIRQPDGHGK